MEIDLTNAKPCPDCRQCLTTDPKCHRCSEKDALIAERDRNHRERVMLLGKWGECKIDCENLIAERDRLRAELSAANGTIAGLREALEKIERSARNLDECATAEWRELGLNLRLVCRTALAETPTTDLRNNSFELRKVELRDDGGRALVELRDSETAKIYTGLILFNGMKTWPDNDTGKPDPRDEALEMAEKALKGAFGIVWAHCVTSERVGDAEKSARHGRLKSQIHDALAAIARAKGGK